MKESDLYLPVKKFLEGQGYEVKAEIGDCDLLAVRGDEQPVIVELKLSLNLTLVLQAVDRLAITPKVYIGVPKPPHTARKRMKRIIKLLRMLGLGLLVIEPTLTTGAVDVRLDPGDYQPRQTKRLKEHLLGEFVRRVGDPNLGGSDKRRGIMTAYRQRAIALGQFLATNGPTKASSIAEQLGEPKARDILYRDVYGWFQRESLGIYSITERGESEIIQWDNPQGDAVSADPALPTADKSKAKLSDKSVSEKKAKKEQQKDTTTAKIKQKKKKRKV